MMMMMIYYIPINSNQKDNEELQLLLGVVQIDPLHTTVIRAATTRVTGHDVSEMRRELTSRNPIQLSVVFGKLRACSREAPRFR